MDKEKKLLSPEELHQRQTWLEIWLPLLIGLAIIVAVMVLLILAAAHGSSSIAQLSAISVILMIFPVLFVCLFSIGILIFTDYWLIRGNHRLPTYTSMIRQKALAFTEKIQNILTSIVAIVMKINSILTTIQSILTPSHSEKK